MLRKFSIKRKHLNRRGKSKQGGRKTKKVQYRTRRRRQSKSHIGGGCGSSSAANVMVPIQRSTLTAFGAPPPEQYTWDDTTKQLKLGGNLIPIPLNADLISMKMVEIIDNMESEKEIIKFLEYIRFDLDTDIMISGDPHTACSLLSYVITKQFATSDNAYMLVRWLIEHGAYVNPNTRSLTRGAHNLYTIVGTVILKLFTVDTSKIIKPGTELLNLINLKDFYYIVYTLILLISRGANMKQQFSVEYEVSTPLLILDGYSNLAALLSFIGKLSNMIETRPLISLLDRESLELYEADENGEDRVINELKILLRQLYPFLQIKPGIDLESLKFYKKECIAAMKQIHSIPPVDTVVWMIEVTHGKNDFKDVTPTANNENIEELFNSGEIVIFGKDVQGKLIEKFDFDKMTYHRIDSKHKTEDIGRRLWRDIRPSVQDMSPPSAICVRDSDDRSLVEHAAAESPQMPPHTVIWYRESDDRSRHERFFASDIDVLEKAYNQALIQGSQIFKHPTKPWRFNFNKMKMTNLRSENEYTIVREQLPPYWEERRDAILGKYYYYNTLTKDITWNIPR